MNLSAAREGTGEKGDILLFRKKAECPLFSLHSRIALLIELLS